MRWSRGAILLALIVAFAVVPLPHANACNCIANSDPRDRLAAAGGAFIGKLVGHRETWTARLHRQFGTRCRLHLRGGRGRQG